MSITSSALRRLATLNLSSEQMAGVLDILADVEAVDEARKAGQRERVRRHREKERYSNVTVTSHNCYAPPPPLLSPTPPNLPPISPQTTLDAGEPEQVREQPSSQAKPNHNDLMSGLTEAAGAAIANPASAPGLLVLSEPMRWLTGGCDLEADILPTIKARCSRAPPGRIRAWSYFTEAVFQARDARLKPPPEPQDATDHHQHNRRQPLTGADAIIAACGRVAARKDATRSGNAEMAHTALPDGR